jgi:5-(carboxyamino)imidazole ribonucleotide synthase
MFALPNGSVAVNEVAPRPHNSGHYTMDACATSQFEQALRAVLGWPLGETAQLSGSAIMYNILVRRCYRLFVVKCLGRFMWTVGRPRNAKIL